MPSFLSGRENVLSLERPRNGGLPARVSVLKNERTPVALWYRRRSGVLKNSAFRFVLFRGAAVLFAHKFPSRTRVLAAASMFELSKER